MAEDQLETRVDISNACRPREIAHYAPSDASPQFVAQSNDMFVHARALVFIDSYQGLNVLEFHW
jgi:hypothetical protein